MDQNQISHIENDIIIRQFVYAWFKEIKNDNECLIHLVPRLLPQNDLLDMLPLLLFKWKDMKLSLNEFYLFFSLSLFSFSLHLNMNDLRYFIRSHWHDDSIWTNISSSSSTQKDWRVIISFCFYSISRRWLSMLWACHFFHKRGNIDRYRKYDTAFSLSYSFFLWSCVILNWINI